MAGISASDILDPTPLHRCELLASLSQDDLDFAASRSGVLNLSPGGRLFSPGERAERFYVVLDGSIRIFKPREDGGEDEMAVFQVGDALGDFDFARRAVYDAYAEARGQASLIVFPQTGLSMDDLAKERPETVSRILLRSLGMIASRLRSTHALISRNAPWVQELRRRSFEDPGTGLWNRAFFDEVVSQDPQAPFALILMKPDRFKLLVDTLGHAAGDEAMIRITGILQSIARRLGRGWAIRLKSNEVALAVNRCGPQEAAELAGELSRSIAAMEPTPLGPDAPAFVFSATLVYACWPEDGIQWKPLFDSLYAFLMESWRAALERAVPGHPPQGCVCKLPRVGGEKDA